MKTLKRIKDYLTGKINGKLSPQDTTEARRVHRRLTKFPRLRGTAQPQIHRTALWRERLNIN